MYPNTNVGYVASLVALLGGVPALFACDLCAISPVSGPRPAVQPTLGIAAIEPAAAPAVPAYSSRPGAPATLFLDFDGTVHNSYWASSDSSKYSGVPGTVPAYSTNSDTGTFTQAELNNIREIWSRVAEAYSPFDINVTTVDPNNFSSRKTARVVIGGSNSWYGPAGGVAYVGGFTWGSQQGNTSWVFPANLSGGNPKTVADAVAHEAGHQFGLSHQRRYDGNGNPLDSGYDYGNSYTAPIMGVAYNARRGLWSDQTIGWNTSTNTGNYQNDLAKLGSTSASKYSGYYNGFGFRADDFGNTVGSAAALVASGNTVSAAGVLEQSTDVDFLEFTTGAGSVSLRIDNAEFGAMLDARLLLYSEGGTLLQSVDPALSSSATGGYGLDAAWSGFLAAGTYAVGVASHGGYGDLGQWFFSGTIIPVPEPAAGGLLGLAALLLRRRAGRRTGLNRFP